LPGSDRILFLDSYDSTDVDTIANFDYGSVDAVGLTICDSMIYLVGGGAAGIVLYRNDSLISVDYVHTDFADYHYAALEDTFLYTITPGDLTCINVADPESIFIYRTYSPAGASVGLEVIDGYAYTGQSYSLYEDIPTYRAWPRFELDKYDMINSGSAAFSTYWVWENRCLGDLTANDDFVFCVHCEMCDGPAWTIGESDLFLVGTDTSYNFDSRWDGVGIFSVDILTDSLLVAGFEHGFSVLNYFDLDDIHEVAYYMDCDSTMDLTHFALKENRLYAMGHPRDDYVRLYMFELDDEILGIAETPTAARPGNLALSAYPNPFNGNCRFQIDDLGMGIDAIEIYDVNGRRIDVIARSPQDDAAISQINRSSVSLDTRRDAVSINNYVFVWQPAPSLGSGVYLIRIKTGGETATRRVVYLK